MSRWDIVLYAVVPYAAIAAFIVGTIWRYRVDQFRWTTRSTQLLESRTLRWSSVIFHYGVLAAIGGHVLGILIPASFTRTVGLTDDAYHVIAGIGGISAGLAVIVGLAGLIYRRFRFPRVRVTTTRMDVLIFALLAVGIVTGMWVTLSSNIGEEVHYRETVAPWFRSLFALDPRPELVAQAPFILQFHVTFVWLLYALWPWSRLVHAWSIPVDWFRRAPILFRSRARLRSGA